MFAGACAGVGQTDDSSGLPILKTYGSNQSRLSEEDTFQMGDEVEMKDNSGMRALTQDQRYAEDTEGRGFEEDPLIVQEPMRSPQR